MSDIQTALKIQDLHKSYGKVKALRGVNLEVYQGEIFGFLGPNGAGKTTTIRCLLDLIRPDKGLISIFGTDPQKDPISVRTKTGYLPGELHLEGNLTVMNNLQYLASLRGKRVEWAYVTQMAERLSLDLKQKVKNLSKGNKQKVGIILALMHHPQLLLLDEPTSGLDPLIQQQVINLIKEARSHGSTIFFSSHVLSEVQVIASRVGLIRQGSIVEVAETEQLIKRSLRRARIQFRVPVDITPLTGVPGVIILKQDESKTNISCQISGEMDNFIKVLAAFPVADVDIERPSLEEIFLAYYNEN